MTRNPQISPNSFWYKIWFLIFICNLQPYSQSRRLLSYRQNGKMSMGNRCTERPPDPVLYGGRPSGGFVNSAAILILLRYQKKNKRKKNLFLGWYKCCKCKILTLNSGGSRIFPGGGANSQNCYYFLHFCRKLHENERIWTPGGACVPGAPLGSANAKFLQYFHPAMDLLLDGISVFIIFPYG